LYDTLRVRIYKVDKFPMYHRLITKRNEINLRYEIFSIAYNSQACRQAGKQAGRQAGKQAGRQAGRQGHLQNKPAQVPYFSAHFPHNIIQMFPAYASIGVKIVRGKYFHADTR
jgi:hypothetical protein